MRSTRLAALAVALTVLACDSAVEPTLQQQRLAPDGAAPDVAAAEAAVLAFGPETFVRANGKPTTERRSFPTADLTAPFTLRLRNGDAAGENRVSAADIVLDGATVFGPSDFNQGVGLLSAVVEPAEEPSTLEVTLAGGPGGEVTIWIEHAGGRALLPVSPEGGTLEVSGGALEVSVPEGAVSEPVTLTAEPPAEEELPAGTTPSPGLTFDFGPDGTTFAEPITLTFHYDEAALPTGTDEASLKAYTLEDGDWVEVPGSTVDVDANVLTVQVDHFSTYGGLPTTVTFCSDPSIPDASQLMRDAIAAVAPGGVVQICEGDHKVEDILVSKSVYIEADYTVNLDGPPGITTTLHSGDVTTFTVNGVTSGTVEFSGFGIVSGVTGTTRVIDAIGEYDVVRLMGMRIDMGAQGIGVAARRSSKTDVTQATVFINTSLISGGILGALGGALSADGDMPGESEMAVSFSYFRNQSLRAIHYQRGGSGGVADNDFQSCGNWGCVAVVGGGSLAMRDNTVTDATAGGDPLTRAIFSAQDGATAVIEGNVVDGCGLGSCVVLTDNAVATVESNQFTVYGDHGTSVGIRVASGLFASTDPAPENAPSLTATGNTVDAVGGSIADDPGSIGNYPLEVGILVGGFATADLNGNSVRAAGEGIQVSGGGSVTGADNTFDLVHTGLSAAANGAVDFHRNDFTRAYQAIFDRDGGLTAGALTCNWWEPGAIFPADVAPLVYTPQASAPIAGDPAVECDPTPTLPAAVRVDPATADSDPLTFPTVAGAVAAVAPGGTIDIADGTHLTQNVLVDKVVTIRAEGPGTPTLDASGAEEALRIEGVAGPGPVLIQGLRFIDARFRAILVTGQHDGVTVDGAVFEPTATEFFSGGFEASGATGAGPLIVRNSIFTGGRVGVHFFDSPGGEVRSNTFDGQGLQAIRYVDPASTGVVQDNDIAGCGEEGCISLLGTGPMTILENRITHDIAGGSRPAITGSAEGVTLHGNIIEGTNGDRLLFEPGTWPLTAAFDFDNVPAPERVELIGNTVRGAYQAVNLGGGVDAAAGNDNVFDGVHTAFHVPVPLPSRAFFHSNDVLDYLVPFEGQYVGGDLVCNWWGGILGPHDVPAGTDAAVYTPWAEGPVAGSSTFDCAGGPPAQVTVDPATADLDPLTFHTVADALAAVAPGGTIFIADGPTHHFVHDLHVDRPVTIEAVSGRPVIDGSGGAGANSFMIENMIDGVVTFRGLRMQGAPNASIFVSQGYERVIIEDVHFFPEANPADDFSSGLFVFAATGNGVTVQASRFEGGNVGVHTNGSDGVEVLNNDFLGQQNFAVTGPLVRLQDNRFSLCPFNGCVRINSGPVPPGPVDIRANDFIIDLTDPAQPGPIGQVMHLQDGGFHVWENVITGIGGTRQPFDDTTWPVQGGAISVDNTGFINIQDNAITGVFSGIDLGAAIGDVHGDGNWIHDVWVGLRDMDGVGSLGLHSSDFENYGIPMEGPLLQGGSLTCNWWGSANGPHDVPGDVAADVYTPWAETSVRDADPPVTSCEGRPAANAVAYVASTAANEVSVIDVATGAVTGTIAVGQDPVDVEFSPDATTAYVVNVNSHDVSVIDVASGSITGSIAFGSFTSLGDMALTPDGVTAYVTNRRDDNVFVVDVASGNIDGAVTVGDHPEAVAFSPDGATAYVVNQGTDGSADDVSVIDVATAAVTATIAVGHAPRAIAIAPDGTSAYVVNLSSNDLSVLDLTTGTVTGTISVCCSPYDIALTPDGGTAYVGHFNGSAISVVDLNAGTVTGSIGVGPRPISVAFTPDGATAYVTNLDSDDVSVIDVATQTVTGTIPVGTDPRSVAITTRP